MRGPTGTTSACPARVVIENVRPRSDDGRHPVKRTRCEPFEVLADVLVDGHDVLAVLLRYRFAAAADWTETAMEPLGNDLWRAEFDLERIIAFLGTLPGEYEGHTLGAAPGGPS